MTAAETAPLIDREPVGIGVGSIVALIDTAIGVGTAFGWWHLTTEQAVQLGLLVTALSGVIGYAIRTKAWSPASVADLVAREA